MKKNWIGAAAGAAIVALLFPYKRKREENGDFTYQSLLLGVSRKTVEGEEKPQITLNIFPSPRSSKPAPVEEEEQVVILPVEPVAPVEAPEAETEETKQEEIPVTEDTPATEEAPSEEPAAVVEEAPESSDTIS